MEIFVKQISSKNGERLEFRLEPSDDISSLKKQVAEKLAISEDCIKLIYKGRFLKDGMNIESSGLSDGSVVHMMKSKGQVSSHTADGSPAHAGTLQTAEVGKAADSPSNAAGNIPSIDRLLSNLGPGNNVERVMESNPEMRAMLENPEQMQQMMSIASNPELRLEYMRNMDRALSNIEAIPGGFNALASMMADMSEAPESSEGFSNEHRTNLNPFLRLYKSQAGSVNENPIPNPWQSPSAPGVPVPRPNLPSQDELANLMESMFSEENIGQLMSATRDPNMRSRILESAPPGERALLESMLTEENMTLFSRVMSNPQFRSMALRQVLEGHESPNVSDDVLQSMLDDVLSSQGNPISGGFSGANMTEPQISEEEMLRKIQVLKDMGFHDEEANRSALRRSGGNVNAAVERLLNM